MCCRIKLPCTLALMRRIILALPSVCITQSLSPSLSPSSLSVSLPLCDVHKSCRQAHTRTDTHKHARTPARWPSHLFEDFTCCLPQAAAGSKEMSRCRGRHCQQTCQLFQCHVPRLPSSPPPPPPSLSPSKKI